MSTGFELELSGGLSDNTCQQGKEKEFAQTKEREKTSYEDETRQKLAYDLLISDDFNLPLHAVRTGISSNELQLRF